ncbi:MAG: PIG-L family deacetylase [Planctomycetes bacterium]|nr:PIG-L family deacetylase [Planctomycetota bacterium]MBU1518872.1 PIG-L family deacetylase [Planctomycetota bacterium]MBU2457159.1 PIG-L family deacetylase [Planctomycetota bacterium]MBU2596344.1 PIG-L family deacetylase [Planctomycetota bacterium]
MTNKQDVFTNAKTGAVIVAHPDDETLWASGVILSHPQINWTILTLCRKSDPDRAPKFFKVANILGAKGFMADLDDGPDQRPLEQSDVQQTILSTLPQKSFDIILTHSPKGEYTRHLRHEETSQAVLSLWSKGKLKAKRLLLFAYKDGGRKYPPRPIENADIVIKPAKNVLQSKKDIIINSYGFSPDSFEAKAVSKTEAFWLVEKPEDTKKVF